jgi:cyclase
MSQASKILLKVANSETQIVPGRGPIQTRTDLQAQSEMLSTVFQRLVKLMKQGMSARDMVAASPTKEFDHTWGNPELFITSAYRGLWGHARELGGVI